MSYYDTIDDDIVRAKEILANGAVEDEFMSQFPAAQRRGTIYGADIYAAYKLLESFVAHIETHFRPDHNGECLNCDEPEDAHGPDPLKLVMRDLVAARAEVESFHGLFSDYEEPCESYEHALVVWGLMKDRESKLHAEITRLRALVDAVGEDVCKLALRQQQKLAHPPHG